MTTPVFGTEEQVYVKTETTFDTFAAFVSGDSLCVTKLSISPVLPFEESKEKCGDPSLRNEFKGTQGGTWSIEWEILTNAVGTAPQGDAIIEAAAGGVFGSNVYALTTTLRSLQIGHKVGDSFFEVVNGAWVTKLEVVREENGAAKIIAEGGFASYAFYKGVINISTVAVGASATLIPLAAGDARKIRSGSDGARVLVTFTGETPSVQVHTITAVDYTANTITVTPGTVSGGTIPANAAVNISVAAFTESGTTLDKTSDDLTIAGTSIGTISYKASLETGIHALDKESTKNRASRLSSGKRTVTGELSGYFLDENARLSTDAWEANLIAINMRLGVSTAGKHFEIKDPNARIEVFSIEIPEAEETPFTATWKSRFNAVANDERTYEVD